MTKIYLIRHGEAEGNVYRVWQGVTNGGISSRGVLQIEALSERFKDIQLDAIYSSDLVRAVKTANAVNKYHNLKIRTDKRLREINCGEWEGKPFGNVAFYYPQETAYFNNDPDKWVVTGAEKYSDVQQRMFDVLNEIAKDYPDKTVAVFSHGMAIRSLLAYINGIRSEEIYKLPHGDNTCVSYIEYESGNFSIKYLNDNSHLPAHLSVFGKQEWWKNSSGADKLDLRDEPLDLKYDSALYAQCYERSWIAAHGSNNGFVASLYLSAAKKHLKLDPFSVLKIYSDDEFVGIIDMDPTRGMMHGYGWISLLYLEKDFRNKGLGVQFLGRAVSFFNDKGRHSIRLHVSEDNVHALHFYNKNNFKIISKEKGSISDLLLMQKEIG